jgi:copper(I)-binding protein
MAEPSCLRASTSAGAWLLLASFGVAASLGCHDARLQVSQLRVERPRASVFPNGGGAAYLTIVNGGSTADRLESAEATWAAEVTLHELAREGEVVSMHEVQGGLAIPAGSSLVLEPGGRHLMLEGVSLAPDAREATLTLRFERAGELRTRLSVESSHF